MLAQGHIAAVAGVPLVNTHVAAYVLVLITFLVCLLFPRFPSDLTDADGQKAKNQ